MDIPPWIDPERDALLTPSALRGIVHPVRLRLLELLQVDGPATATSLANRIGQSSGVASYHLRVLAEHGFIEEDAERGTGRDRWWKAVHRGLSFTFRAPEDESTPETLEQAESYLRYNADEAYRRMIEAVSRVSADDELRRGPWALDDWALRLTIDEARALTEQIRALVSAYRREPGDPDPREDTVRATFQFQMLPGDAS